MKLPEPEDLPRRTGESPQACRDAMLAANYNVAKALQLLALDKRTPGTIKYLLKDKKR